MPFDHFTLAASLYNRVGDYSSLETMLEAAQLPTAGRLLDVGGGTGRVASALLHQAAQVIVVDLSLGMLRFAASKPGLQAAAAFSEHLPFPDDTFDRVIMVDALHHVLDHAGTAKEMLRVLKPDGCLVIEEPDIRRFGVKLIALAEKLLLMRSHFLAPPQIETLFPSSKRSVVSKDSSAWIVIHK